MKKPGKKAPRSRIGIILVAATLLAAACATVQSGYYRFNEDIGDPVFLDLMSEISDFSMVGGNRVELLKNGDESFSAMLEAIGNATESINLETYIFWGDSAGEVFVQAMAEKARQGVQVRVLWDDVGGRRLDHLIPVLEESGVQWAAFKPWDWWHLLDSNLRTHRKILVVDGRIGFTGGIGIGDKWEGDADSPDHWRDTQVKVEGPVVRQLQWLFAENWERTIGEDIEQDPMHFPPLSPAGEMLCGVVGGVRDERNWSNIREMWLLPLAASREYFYLSIAYFIPDADTMKALREASGRGVDIRFIVPGPENDVFPVRMVSQKYYGKLLDAGIRIYEYQETNMHSKTGVCDDMWSTVGSANYENRAFSYNYESNLMIYDRDFAFRMKQMFREDLAQSEEIDAEKWKNRPIYYKFLEQIFGVIEGWI